MKCHSAVGQSNSSSSLWLWQSKCTLCAGGGELNNIIKRQVAALQRTYQVRWICNRLDLKIKNKDATQIIPQHFLLLLLLLLINGRRQSSHVWGDEDCNCTGLPLFNMYTHGQRRWPKQVEGITSKVNLSSEFQTTDDEKEKKKSSQHSFRMRAVAVNFPAFPSSAGSTLAPSAVPRHSLSRGQFCNWLPSTACSLWIDRNGSYISIEMMERSASSVAEACHELSISFVTILCRWRGRYKVYNLHWILYNEKK